MFLSAGLRRVWLCLAAASLIAALPRAAAADDLRADFDRDGVSDVVTLDPASAKLLHVWLSTTQTERELRTSRPVYRMAAIDLDGDGRLELVVSDTKAALHVWRQADHGRMRPVRPHHAPRPQEARNAANFHEDPAQSETAIPTRNVTPLLDPLPRTPLSPPLTPRGILPATSVTPFDRPASPWSSRAPPCA